MRGGPSLAHTEPEPAQPLEGQAVTSAWYSQSTPVYLGHNEVALLRGGDELFPAMIRAMTDDQALEAMVVENLQRDDLAPLEEAEGYETLMQHAGLTSDQVAAKIGKSRSYVYARLKLLDLCQEARLALRDDNQVIATHPEHPALVLGADGQWVALGVT